MGWEMKGVQTSVRYKIPLKRQHGIFHETIRDAETREIYNRTVIGERPTIHVFPEPLIYELNEQVAAAAESDSWDKAWFWPEEKIAEKTKHITLPEHRAIGELKHFEVINDVVHAVIDCKKIIPGLSKTQAVVCKMQKEYTVEDTLNDPKTISSIKAIIREQKERKQSIVTWIYFVGIV